MIQIATVTIRIFIEIYRLSSLTFNFDLPYVADRTKLGDLLGVHECRLEAV